MRTTFRIWRGEKGAGAFRDYDLEVSEGMVVLDALHEIQAEQANDLAVRWNCKAGKCGSCSAEVNGMPKLMCMTRLSDLDLTKPVTVEPMRAFPPLRDHRLHDAFIGPRFLVQVAALEMHPLDVADRVPALKAQHGIGYCNITKCCTVVCPENITITDNAIIPLKERVIDEYYDPIGRLVKIFSRRSKKEAAQRAPEGTRK